MLRYKLAQNNDIDFEDFYKIKSDADNIKWSGFLTAPEKKSFRKWYAEQINSTKRDIYLVYFEGVANAVAFFYIDYCDNGEFFVPSGVLAEFTRRGIGTWIIQESDKIAKEKGYKVHVAMVSDLNVGSIKRFEKLGFTRTTDYDVRDVPLAGGKQKYYKWVRYI